MRNFRQLVMVLLVCVVSASALAQNAGVELLKRMEEKFQNLQSVSGSFVQSRTDPEFKMTRNDQARFWILKPNHYRAEYQGSGGQPGEVQLITGQTFYNYVPQLKQVATYKFRGESNVRDLNYMLLGFGAKAEEVQKVYTVQPLQGGTGVQLTPRDPQQASFRYILMKVNSETLYPESFTMRQPDGTDMTITLGAGSLQVNPQISANDFRPNFPRDAVQVNMQ